MANANKWLTPLVIIAFAVGPKLYDNWVSENQKTTIAQEQRKAAERDLERAKQEQARQAELKRQEEEKVKERERQLSAQKADFLAFCQSILANDHDDEIIFKESVASPLPIVTMQKLEDKAQRIKSVFDLQKGVVIPDSLSDADKQLAAEAQSNSLQAMVCHVEFMAVCYRMLSGDSSATEARAQQLVQESNSYILKEMQCLHKIARNLGIDTQVITDMAQVKE